MFFKSSQVSKPHKDFTAQSIIEKFDSWMSNELDSEIKIPCNDIMAFMSIWVCKLGNEAKELSSLEAQKITSRISLGILTHCIQKAQSIFNNDGYVGLMELMDEIISNFDVFEDCHLTTSLFQFIKGIGFDILTKLERSTPALKFVVHFFDKASFHSTQLLDVKTAWDAIILKIDTLDSFTKLAHYNIIFTNVLFK